MDDDAEADMIKSPRGVLLENAPAQLFVFLFFGG